jgi:hypothetical protein
MWVKGSQLLCIGTGYWGQLKSLRPPSHYMPRGLKGQNCFLEPWGVNHHFSILTVVFCSCCICVSSKSSYHSCQHQTCMTSTWCWFSQHIECKNYGVIAASTKISKEGLSSQQKFAAEPESLQRQSNRAVPSGAVGVEPDGDIPKFTAASNTSHLCRKASNNKPPESLEACPLPQCAEDGKLGALGFNTWLAVFQSCFGPISASTSLFFLWKKNVYPIPVLPLYLGNM